MVVSDCRNYRSRVDELFRSRGFSRPSFPEVSSEVFPIIRDAVELEGAFFVHDFARQVGNLFRFESGLLDSLKQLGRSQGPGYGVRLVHFSAVIWSLYDQTSYYSDRDSGISMGMHLFYSSPDALTEYVKQKTCFDRGCIFWNERKGKDPEVFRRK